MVTLCERDLEIMCLLSVSSTVFGLCTDSLCTESLCTDSLCKDLLIVCRLTVWRLIVCRLTVCRSTLCVDLLCADSLCADSLCEDPLCADSLCADSVWRLTACRLTVCRLTCADSLHADPLCADPLCAASLNADSQRVDSLGADPLCIPDLGDCTLRHWALVKGASSSLGKGPCSRSRRITPQCVRWPWLNLSRCLSLESSLNDVPGQSSHSCVKSLLLPSEGALESLGANEMKGVSQQETSKLLGVQFCLNLH